MPDAPSSVHLSVASSSSLQVTFWEPLSVNSAIVTKYKGKDQDPRSRARSHSHSRCLAPRGNSAMGSAAKPQSGHFYAGAQKKPGLLDSLATTQML